MVLALHQCRFAAEAGPKAMWLARARAAGFVVLDGIVLLPGDPVDLVAVAQLGTSFAVRSSSTAEDDAVRTAAGLFQSVIGVAVDEVEAAVRRVRESGHSERARSYGAEGDLAVLIQPVAVADTLLVAMSEGDRFVVEERPANAPEWVTPAVAEPDGLVAGLLRRLRDFFGAPFVAELARRGDVLTLLQIRPRPDGEFAAPLPDATFAVPGSWQRDAHNPAPLSTAQAELVALVEKLGVGPPQRVLGGYLYYSPTQTRGEEPWADRLGERFDELATLLRATLGRTDSVAGALAAYADVYRRYVVEIAPTRRRARQRLDQALRDLGTSLDEHGALLDGVGGASTEREALLRSQAPWQTYVAAFGAWAPGWDVALPCDDESRARVEQLAATLARAPEKRPSMPDPIAEHIEPAILAAARDAIRIGEDDDALFFAAQHAVRQALLRRGQELAAAGRLDDQADIFDLPFDLPDGDLRAQVATAQRERRRAQATLPPDAIDDGVPRALAVSGPLLVGRATFGQANGRIVHLDAHTPLPLLPDAVVWVKALLPSLAPLVLGAAALITEEGGVASHGALLARERGKVAVLGVGAATIADGTRVLVDGAAGTVRIL